MAHRFYANTVPLCHGDLSTQGKLSCFSACLETRSCYLVKAAFKFRIFLPQPWNAGPQARPATVPVYGF